MFHENRTSGADPASTAHIKNAYAANSRVLSRLTCLMILFVSAISILSGLPYFKATRYRLYPTISA